MPEVTLDELTKSLVDRGKLIQAGWIALRVLAIPEDAPQVQIIEMQKAFFSGAQHLLSSIMTMLEPGGDPTEKDIKRLESIHEELKAWVEKMKKEEWIKPTGH